MRFTINEVLKLLVGSTGAGPAPTTKARLKEDLNALQE